MDSNPQRDDKCNLRNRFPKMNVCTSQCFSNSLRVLSELEESCLKECLSPMTPQIKIKWYYIDNVAEISSYTCSISFSLSPSQDFPYLEKLKKSFNDFANADLRETGSRVSRTRPRCNISVWFTVILDFLTSVPNFDSSSRIDICPLSLSQIKEQWIRETEGSSRVKWQSDFRPMTHSQLSPSLII